MRSYRVYSSKLEQEFLWAIAAVNMFSSHQATRLLFPFLFHLTYETWREIDNFDDVQEVVNYIKALNTSIEMLDKLPLGLRIIKEAHRILLQGERGKNKEPGEFRRSQNWIGGSNLKNALFVPPPPP